jgi:hypothetical protein
LHSPSAYGPDHRGVTGREHVEPDVWKIGFLRHTMIQ